MDGFNWLKLIKTRPGHHLGPAGAVDKQDLKLGSNGCINDVSHHCFFCGHRIGLLVHWIAFKMEHHLFPERRFVAGFFRRLLAYLTPHISHTYPSHHTYPCKTYPTNTYPTNTYPFNTYPTNTYPFNTYPTNTYPCDAFPFTRIPPTRICSTRIPPIRINEMRIHSIRIHSKGLHQQEWQTYPTNTYPTIRIRSTRIPPVRIHTMRIHSKGLHQREWQCMWMQNISLHIIASAGMAMSISIIACHFIPLLLGGNGNENRNLAFPSISLQHY